MPAINNYSLFIITLKSTNIVIVMPIINLSSLSKQSAASLLSSHGKTCHQDEKYLQDEVTADQKTGCHRNIMTENKTNTEEKTRNSDGRTGGRY